MSEQLAGEALLDALESGDVRVAEPAPDGAWTVNSWVKQGILEIFKSSEVVPVDGGIDKAAFPVRSFAPGDGVRLVPGGSAVRRGAHVGKGVVIMPPAYINVGAFVGEGSMIDSHALVGSCAQIGARVHVSAGVQIGGVLEPIGANPVIVEDDVLVGGQAGLFEGVIVRTEAVIAAGTILTATTPVYDLVNRCQLRGSPGSPLEIPAGAVVVPGTRPAAGEYARSLDLSVACALIVKHRDGGTDARTTLEDALR